MTSSIFPSERKELGLLADIHKYTSKLHVSLAVRRTELKLKSDTALGKMNQEFESLIIQLMNNSSPDKLFKGIKAKESEVKKIFQSSIDAAKLRKNIVEGKKTSTFQFSKQLAVQSGINAVRPDEKKEQIKIEAEQIARLEEFSKKFNELISTIPSFIEDEKQFEKWEIQLKEFIKDNIPLIDVTNKSAFLSALNAIFSVYVDSLSIMGIAINEFENKHGIGFEGIEKETAEEKQHLQFFSEILKTINQKTKSISGYFIKIHSEIETKIQPGPSMPGMTFEQF